MDQKSIIITSNCGLNELKNADMRIFSRLAEMSYLLRFENEDFRLMRKATETNHTNSQISNGTTPNFNEKGKRV